MKKKPEQYTRAGKSNVTLRNFLNNLKENDLHFENNQITQCVFLGVLRLKPVPTIFSSNNTSSDSSSVVESKPRRFRNNNSNKEGNKNISRKKDINKVISGKIRKKNPEKIKASVKKVPVKKPIIKVKLNMKKKTPNSSPSKEPNTPSSDLIEDNGSLKLPSSPPAFNPIDNLFSKLKQQIEHSQPGPSGVLPQDFLQTSEQGSVCKINVNRQLRYPMKSKKSKKLSKKKSIIHERLAMPLLPGGHESVTSSDSSGFKEDLASSSSHTSGSPISEQDLSTSTADVIVVSPEVPKASKQKERTSPRNKGNSKPAANDEEVFWINDRPEGENLEESYVIVIPDNVAEVPCGNSSRNNVIIIDETRGPRLSPRSKKTNEKTHETNGNGPNINSRPSSKQSTTQSGEKPRSDFSTQSMIFDVKKTNEKPITTLLKTVEPALESTGEVVEAEKPFDKPRRRRRLMPTAIPSIFFNTPMLLRSELAQKKPIGPEKKPVARGLSRLLRSELNKQEKPPKARNSNSQATEEASSSKLSKPPQKNYKQNDNLIYEVVKPAGLATTHTNSLSESSSSSGNEVICLDDAPPKVEPLIIKLKVSQQKNFETSPKTKGESAKEKRNSYENSDSISRAPEKSALKPQMIQLEGTKGKETGFFPPQLKSDTVQQKEVKPEVPAEVTPPENVPKEKTILLSVKSFETLCIDTSDRKSSPEVASPKKPLAKVSPKPVEINLVEEEKQVAKVATKNTDLVLKEFSTVDTINLTLPEKFAAKVSPKPVEEKVQKKAIEPVSNNSGNEKNISIVKPRGNTRRLLLPENVRSNSNQNLQKTVDPRVILISDETQTSSDCIDVTDEVSLQKEADVVCQSPKESAKSKYFEMFSQNHFLSKNDTDQELSHIETAPEVIDLCSSDQTDVKESKKISEQEKRITIHSDFKIQCMKDEESQGSIHDGDSDKNGNTKDNINANPRDEDVSSKNTIESDIAEDTKINVDLIENSLELEDVIFIPKTTRSSVVKEQLVTPKPKLSDKNIEANIAAPITPLAETVKTEELDTEESTLENISKKETKRTLRSEKSATPPVQTAEIQKPTGSPLAQSANTGVQKLIKKPEVSKTPIKPSAVATSKLSETAVANTVISEKMVEKTAPSNKRGSKEPEEADMPPRLLRSDKGQQKLIEDKNKNILPDSKIKPPKSVSSKQAKKITAQNNEPSKVIDQDIETLRNETAKESSKNDKSRSSISQKSQKQHKLDEIIVLSEKKAKKPRKTFPTRLLRSSLIEPSLDSDMTTIKSDIEKVVVLVYDEPKSSKQSIADTASTKRKFKRGVLFPRSLRSQKKITDLPPVKLNSRKGRKPALPVVKKSSPQDDKFKTAIKNKPSMKTQTLGVGLAKENKRSKALRVLTKNGPSIKEKKKIPISKRVTRQKISQPLRRLRQRAVANVPRREWLPAKARADKLQKQIVAKNKQAPKGKKSVEWKNNEIIEKIIQEIRNTIFQGDNVEDNLQLEEGNLSSEENSPKENIVPAKRKAEETGKLSDKKKKIRRPSLKEIRNTRNTRANHQRGHYKTRQGYQNAKINPKRKAFNKKPAETTSKRASQRVAQKVTKEDLAPNDPSLTTVDAKEEEIEIPNNFEPKEESAPCFALDEANEADNEPNIFNVKETYQMVNSYLEEIVEDEENKAHLKRKSEDLEYEMVARKQIKIIPGEMGQSLPQLNQDEVTLSKDEATVSKAETSGANAEAKASKAKATLLKDEATASKAKATVLKHEATVSRAKATVLKDEAIASKAKATVLKDEATASKAKVTVLKDEATVPKAKTTLSKAEARAFKAEARAFKAETTSSKADSKAKAKVFKNEATVFKDEATVSKANTTVSKAKTTVSKAKATVSKDEATVSKAEAAISKAEVTVSKAEATVSKAKTTLSKAKTTVSKAKTTVSKDEATVSKAEATVSKTEASKFKADATVSRADAAVIQAKGGISKAVGKAIKRPYKKRTSIKPVEESPVVDVEQISTQLNKIEEDNPMDTVEMFNGEDQSVKIDEVEQDDGEVEAKRQCKTQAEKQSKTEFVRILEKLVKEMLPTEDLQQNGSELDQARCSTSDADSKMADVIKRLFKDNEARQVLMTSEVLDGSSKKTDVTLARRSTDANAKLADVIKRLCEDNEERQVAMTSEVPTVSSKKADITVFDFDESEPEVTPLRHKVSPEKPAVAGKEKMWSRIEQAKKEVAKKVQRRPKVKEEDANSDDESQTSTNVEVPKKMWSRIEKPMEDVGKKAQRRPNTNEECAKTRDEPKTSSSMELEVPKKRWSRIEVPTELKPPPAPKTNPRKSVEAAESPQGSPTKAASPMKQPTIIEMFNKVRLKLEQGGSGADSAEDSPVANRAAAVAAQSRVSVEEANFSAMPPPKTERLNYKAESMEDDDSDCESRAEWIPEEYAEYKMKYSAQKMMQYKPVFKCKVCLKVLPSYYRLTKHRKEHELRDNPYVCRECDADFGNIDELTAHLRVHKGKFPYTCSKCSVGFWTKKAFDAHAPVHVLRKLKPPVKKFRCDVCAKEFSKLCDIDRHMRVHTGEKPCICNICNKGFQQSHNLSKHLLTHLHIRPFHCEICDKQFGRGDVLARHVLTHSIDKPIKCWVCYKGFIRQTQLVQHHQKYHRDQPLVKPEPEEDDAEEAA